MTIYKIIMALIFTISSSYNLLSQNLEYPNPFNSTAKYQPKVVLNRMFGDSISRNSVIDTIIVKDTLYKPNNGYILDSVTVQINNSDSSNNISSVYFISLKPDGTYANGGNPLILQKKANGLFFLVFQLNSSVQIGTYKWTFFAIDSSDNVRDSIVKLITVIENPTGIKDIDIQIKYYQLDQNYPNPFNPTTIIVIQFPNKVKWQ